MPQGNYPSAPGNYPGSANLGNYPGVTQLGTYPSSGVNFTAEGAAFWDDSSNPASYTASGANLTSIKNLVSGSVLSTIVGAPQIFTDPRDDKASFYFPNSPTDLVKGVDANLIAAVTGTNTPFLFIEVINPGLMDNNAASLASYNTVNSQGRDFLAAGGGWYVENDGPLGAKAATSEFVRAGTSVLMRYSLDGLTVATSVNGGPESTATMASAGALAPNLVSIGGRAAAADLFPYYGLIKEQAYLGSVKTPADRARYVAALMSKWPLSHAPQIYFLGDSQTTTFPNGAVTNGGMTALLTQAIRAAGGYVDPVGPYGVNQIYPYRMSGVGGDTCAMMNTRVTSTTLGLGLGGSSLGHYRRVKLVCLLAGANDVGGGSPNPTNYQTLLNNTYAQLIQGQPTGKIAVSPTWDITGESAAIATWNAALQTIWTTFEAAHPGVLLHWDAFNAVPNDGGTTYYNIDHVHWNNAGFVKAMNDPVYGLLQAVMPYLLSIQ